ncbi:DUF2125 domain-containing protein [Rhizobium sp. CG5]|uniref:DUF2125 domain-containing protein n=1 Tax=Rhizobium sp. CG5 TaxID=2726076 RepID=UPI0020332B1E|nr:DUF2125 domain-containing protein [Rhizobium sp. CG5]MCM2475221.1 DUF2125 domain-containing protein [Rhizobium sp. CG5]
MATSSRTGKTSISTKVLRLGVVVFLLTAAYCAAWYYAAGLITARVERLLDGDNRFAAVVDCQNRDLRGFPFRFGLFCSSVEIDDVSRGISGSFGELRTAALVYQPGKILWELEGPGMIRSADGLTIASQWSRLRSSLHTGFSGMSSGSTVIDDLKTSITMSFAGQTLDITVPHGEVHTRRAGDDLDGALLIKDTQFSLRDVAQTLPPVSASIDFTVADRAMVLDYGRKSPVGFRGTKGEIRSLVVDLGQGRVLTVAGPVSIAEDGLLSGTLRLEIEGIDGWRDQVRAAFPEIEDMANLAAKVLKAMSGGDDKGNVTLTVTDGDMTLGFIPIGRLPPV